MIETIYPIPAFKDNYIWAFRDSNSNNACVVDPGDADPVIQYLDQNNLNLSHILITHHHPDHTGGVKQLRTRYKPFIYGPVNSPFKGSDQFLKEGDEIDVYGLEFSVLQVPGHTLDHIAYYCDRGPVTEQPILFCGDTLFAAGCGRIFEGDPQMMYASLQKLATLDSNARVYCTHEYTLANLAFAEAAEPGNKALQERIVEARKIREQDNPTLPSSLSLELATNPFLRCSEESLKEAAAAREGTNLLSPVEVFASIRGWKDNF